MGYALLTVHVTWTSARVLLLIISPLSGAVLLGAIWVAATSVCFWVVDGRELANSVTYGSNQFTSYPITIFSGWVRRLLPFVVPGAFVAYYPVLGLLGKPDPLDLPTALQWCAPLVAAVAVGAAGLVWRTGLQRYVGTLRAVHRVPPAVFAQRLERHVELLDMAGFLRVPVRQLSLGQRMRGELTAALLHDPELVVLDEPTIGLDLTSKERLRGFLAGVNAERGVTLLLTTHDLPDVERLCRRLVVIDHGRVLVDGDLCALRRRFGGARQLLVELVEPSTALEGLLGVLGVTVEAAGLRQRLAFSPSQTTAATLIAKVARRVAVRDLTVTEPSIEDLVRTLCAS